MKETVEMNWLNNLAFEAVVNGHKIYLDSSVENGGKNLGPRPKPLMLVALGGCTGMDVVSLLKKMKVEFDSFSVIVEGDITEEHPKTFYKMKVIYSLKGKNIPVDKVQKAVNLSKDKYCGVHEVYRKVMNIDFEIKINDKSY